MLEPHQKTIIELFQKQEAMLAGLYKIFARNFPEHREFWLDMVNDELKHVDWVKKFYFAEQKALVAFSEGRVKTYTLKNFIGHVEKVIKQAENNELGLKQSVVYALDLERALIEKDVFTHFEILDESMRGVMTKLENETRVHIKKVEDLLRKIQ